MLGSPSGKFSLPPVYGGRCPQGGRGDKVAKQRRCWVLPLPLLLLRRCLQRLGNEKPYCAAQCRSYSKCKKQAAPAQRAEARPMPVKRCKCWARQAASLIGIVRRRKNLSFSKWRRKALCEFRLGNTCASVKPRWLCSFYQQQHSW